MLTYTITADDHCRRLESWLQRLLPTALPAYCRKLIKSGACTLNGTKSSPDTLLSAGAIISLKESGQVLELLNRPLPPIDLLWQDDRLLAINKPGRTGHAPRCRGG
jgi:Pseudouridylate synthases, 23S RNA-specific